ncbi:MAG: hypothetical protein VX745_00805 [Pseudomonadota bacterium]|nr:hypothetical protein [Pseudomonadota bacterium]
MASKTSMTNHIKRMDTSSAAPDLRALPALATFRDPHGRSWLNLMCSINLAKQHIDPVHSIEIADVLLPAGLPLDEPALVQGTWEATPLRHIISFTWNLIFTRHLLSLGCAPEHCL